MRVVLAITLSVLLYSGTVASAAPHPAGIWVTQEGRSLMSVAPCDGSNNKNGVLCSKIIWLKQPFDKNGEPLRDSINANPALRRRTIVGMPVLSDMQPKNGEWEGKVYNPEDGKKYRAVMMPQGRKKLLVKGCAKVLFNWVCRERIWDRASERAIKAAGMPLEQAKFGHSN